MKRLSVTVLFALLFSATLLGANANPALTPIINLLLSSSNDYGTLGNYTVTRYPDAGLHDNYVVYYPTDAIKPDMPVVLFLEGGGSAPHIDDYRGVMKFLASQGYFVIGAESGTSYDSDYARRIFEGALNTAKSAHGLNISKLAVMGHSQGGGQAFYVMKYFQDPQHGGYGSRASLVLSIDGWFSFSMNKTDLDALKGRIAFLQMNGLRGTGTDPRINLSIWNLAHRTEKTFLTLPQNNHGYVAGSLETLLRDKHDLLEIVGALCYDAFHQTQSGYNTLPTERKAAYSDIYNTLQPQDQYNDGDCEGIMYNARENMLKFYDIDYCAVDANGAGVARTIDRDRPNLLHNINPNFNTLAGYYEADKHGYIANDSHTADGSGSAELLAHHWDNALTSAAFPVRKGKKYLLSGYIKMTHVPRGQNVTFALWPRSVVGWSEVAWNVSKANEWQEILLPFTPVADGDAYWGAFTTTRAFSTDYIMLEPDERHHWVERYQPNSVAVDGSNLDRSSRVFLDDFKVIEITEEITPRETVNTQKQTFESDYIRVDHLGNFSVNKAGNWVPIFPKLIARCNEKPEDRFERQLRDYVNHGFNGVIAMYNVDQVKKAYAAGLEYLVGMGAHSNTLPDGSEGEYSSLDANSIDRLDAILDYIKKQNRPYSLLFHYLDNENEKVQEYAFKQKWARMIDSHDKDRHNRRARPIFYLNGTFGISRLYSKALMDITGAYVGMGGTGSSHEGAPKPTIGIMDVTQAHTIPSNVIQLQVYLDDKFIPSLWFGIIQGGKAVAVWKDGNGDGSSDNKPKPFQEYTWAPKINKVFAEVDRMAAIIREPHWTAWKVHLQGSEYVNIGTREHNGDAFVIISNHSDNDERIRLSFEGITPHHVTDYLGNSGSHSVENGSVSLQIGHGNSGYLVLKLLR